MAIQRFNSIGSNTPRFRHNSLVALRYEETAQAEPPIPLPQQQQQQQQRQQHGGSNTSRLPRSRSVRSQAPSQAPPLDVAAVKDTLVHATVLDTVTLDETAAANRNAERHTAAETQPAARLSLTDLPATHPAPGSAEMRRQSLPPPPRLSPSSAAVTPSSPVLSSPLAPVTSRRPLVIVCPPSLVAPPAEDHPALRQRRFRPIVEEANESDDAEDAKSRATRSRAATGNGQNKDAFKRDSLIASATTSTTTLGQEDNDRNAKRDRFNGYAATRMHRSTSASSGQSVSTTASTAASTAPCPVAHVPLPANTCPAAKENAKIATAKPPSATVRSRVPPVRVSTGVRAATKPAATSPKPIPKPAVAREAHWWQSKPMRRFGFSSGPSGPSSESSLPRSQGNKKTSSSHTAVAANVAAAENQTHKAQARPQHGHDDKGALRGGQPQADDRRRVWKQEAASGTRVYTYTPILPCHTATSPPPARLTKTNPNAAWLMRNAPSGSSSASCSSASSASLSFSSPPSSPHPTTSPLSPASSIASSFSSSSSSIPVPARSFVRVSSMSGPQPKTTPPTRTKTKTRAGAVSSSSATTPPPAATVDTPLLRTAIPTESLIEDDFLASLTFSKRGSILLGGARALAMADDDVAAAAGAGAGDAAAGDGAAASSAASSSSSPAGPAAVSASSPARLPRSPASPWSPWSPLSLRPQPLPLAVARESHKVRSLYAAASTRGGGSGYAGGGLRWQDGRPPSVVVGGVAVEAIGEKEGASAPAVATEAAAPPRRPSSSAPHGSTAMTDKNAAPSIHSPDLSSLSRPGGAGDGDGDGLLQPYPYPYPYPPSAAAAAARISIVSSTSATSAPTSLALSNTASTEEGGDTTSTLPSTAGQTGETGGVDTTTAATSNNNNFLAVPAAGSSSTPSSPTIDPAGGIEDWEDVDVADVDRFGFIHVRQRPHTSASTAGSNTRGDGGGGFLRRRGSRQGRHLQDHGSNHYNNGDNNDRPFGARSVHSRMTTAGGVAAASLRAAANRLPHNRDRRWVDGAGDMLALAPGGLADIAEGADAVRVAEVLKRKEAERAEKWRRMAKVVGDGGGGGGGGGGGMTFEFDPRHPKLVERTWKGIPDCWRAAAWYSFLATSARGQRQARAGTEGGGGEGVPERDGGETEEQIVAAFRALQEQGSPDDVQIDLDVPRTVNGHVMFRRRYRGGQRLLFRVLHAVSLYFPATGYVQGMASLAATLLCYFDEERSFVMLVRLFHLRGLERLYQPGFGGLLEALAVLEQRWLRTTRHNRAVAARLAALGIDAPTYATRWYLTVFNLSVPFRAQLRIWDVFLLLGGRPVDEEEEAAAAAAAAADPTLAPVSGAGADPPLTAARANLDVLHATSAALLDGLHEVLVDADFENAMKTLTAWVPIKDEELLMKVVRAEWKRHQKE